MYTTAFKKTSTNIMSDCLKNEKNKKRKSVGTQQATCTRGNDTKAALLIKGSINFHPVGVMPSIFVH